MTLSRSGDAILAHAVDRRLLAGDQAGPVGLADRRGHVEAREAHALGGQAIQVRRAHGGIAVAAQVIRPLLVGDEEHETGGGAWSLLRR
ncbi:hypothetical protein GCM10009016_18110 [Halomonas beimenensis]